MCLLPPSVRPSAACVLFSLCFLLQHLLQRKNRCNQSSVTFQSLGYLFAPTKFCQSIVLRLAERSLPRHTHTHSVKLPPALCTHLRDDDDLLYLFVVDVPRKRWLHVFPVFTTFKLKRERESKLDVLFVAASGPFLGDRFNPFLVSDSAQWEFFADLCRCLIVYIDLSLLHSKPVNTRKAFVCDKTVEHFFSCLSLAFSIALVIFGSTTKTKT